MNSVDWARIETLFHECLARGESGRQGVLAAEPPDIRAAVQRLLAADGGADRLAKVVQNAAALVTQPSDTVGAYRLVREVGRGGMGSVYLAVRADAAFERRVAVKFVRHNVDSPQLRERFDSERRILARLEHPYIARLLDAGATAVGQPYLVMEYVEGQTIVAYAQSRVLSVRERIALFRKVCEAIHYAHQNLVVHRDLKPGNVLIDASGTPKLLDFGIAKLLGGDSDTAPAQTLMRVLTPDYASPEQVRGDVVTTATDVYSLGAVLFELLAGEAPFRQQGRTPAETERAVQQGLARRPSDCAPELRRELRGDLDNIVMKAMRREPAERYASAADLSADLERVLTGRPVRARDYTAWERSAKFAGRHQGAVLAACAVLACIVSGTLVTARYAIRAEDARRVAVNERHRAEAQRLEALRQAQLARDREADANAQRGIAGRRLREQEQVITSFLDGFYGQIRSLPGATAARKRILDASLKQLEQLHRESPQDLSIARTLGLAYQEMGVLLGDPIEASLGDAEGGLRMLRRAAGIFEDLHRAEPGKAPHVLELSRTDGHIAYILAYGARNTGPAFQAADRAVNWARSAIRLTPGDAQAQDVLGYALLTRVLLAVRYDLSRFRLEDAAEVRQLMERLLAREPRNSDYLSKLSDGYSAEAQYRRYHLDYNAALPLAEKALSLREQVSELSRNDTMAQRNLMMSYSHVADYYTVSQPPAPRARECYERMVAIAERLALGDPADRTAQYDLAMSLIRLAVLHRDLGDTAAGVKYGEQSIRIFRGLRREMQENLMWRLSLAYALMAHGRTCGKAGRREEAGASLRESLAEHLAVAQQFQRPEEPLRQASAAAAYLAEFQLGADDAAAMRYADQSVELADRARKVPGSGAFTLMRVAQSRGDASFLYARIADERHDDGLRARARDLAAQSVAAMAALREEQMEKWPRADRERVKALAAP
jgi:tRNA A-37 threonylcarbamoyl transferase component Bud32